MALPPQPDPSLAIPPTQQVPTWHPDTAPPGHTTSSGGRGPLVLEPGQRPVPDYELIERLGAGGFGEVWKARGPGGIMAALKFVRLDGKAGAFEQRALDLIKEVRDPHLLDVYGAWQCQGMLILAMQLADKTLFDRLEECRRAGQKGIPREELLDYLRDAARGLDFLNERGIQHRDVKPHNLLLVGGGVRVSDFGLAKLMENTVTSNTGALTVAYAAPEFFHGQTSNRSDQYSLAVTYCQLRCGELPFRGPASMIMAGHVMHAPDLTLLPPAEWPAVARALAKKPEDRWPSCREFVAAVAASWSGGLSTTVPMEPVSANDEWATKIGASPQPLRARPWRRPVVVSIVAFLVLAPLLAWIFFTLSSMARDRNAGSSSSDNLLAAGATQKAEPAAVPAPRREVPAERPPPAGENGPEPAPVPKPPASPPTPVALSLAGLEDLSLEPGDGKVFDVEIRGAEKGDRVTLTLQGLPAGIRQEAIPGEPARHRFRLTADYATKDVAAPVTVLARAGDRSAEARFRVAVKAHQNSLGMAFVRIPAGRFRIGSPENDPEALGWEKPQHEVEMTQPFYLGRAEVTRGQFRRFVEATGYKTEAESDDKGGFGYDGQKRDFQANKKYSWRDPGFEQTDDHPVVNVSWNDAQKFCAWLGEQEGKRYRLPTEAEWEYGCRANTSTRFHSGDEGASLKDVANLRDAAAREQFGGLTTFTERDGYVFTAPVGTFKPNDFGLHDMHGNVAEWCADWHSLTYYRSSPAQDPPGPDGGTFRVIRGGSFFDSPRGVRAADRRRDLPAGRSYDVGFRVVAVR